MPEVKMSARHQRPVNRNDIVVKTALTLGISPEEVFRRAYAGQGNSATEGEDIFSTRYYPGTEGRRFHIPLIVKSFCEAGINCTVCGADEPKDAKKMFSRAENNGAVVYFCSLACMNKATSATCNAEKNRGRKKQVGDASGKEVFYRISRAISLAQLVTVPEHEIRFMPNQPRKYFDQAKLQSLADSMILLRGDAREDEGITGQMMPGFIRAIPEDKDGCLYELLDGERRLRAVRLAEIQHYRAMLIDLDDEGARHVVSIIANFNREGHTVLEMADTIAHLHIELGFTFNEIADITDKHYIQVLDFYRLRNLHPEVRDMLDPDKVLNKKKLLTQGAAFEIAKLDYAQQLGYAKRSVEEGLRVADLKEQVRESRAHVGGNSRAISVSERRTTLLGSVRRLPTPVRLMLQAVRVGERDGAIAILDEEERRELHQTLSECRNLIDAAMRIVEPST